MVRHLRSAPIMLEHGPGEARWLSQIPAAEGERRLPTNEALAVTRRALADPHRGAELARFVAGLLSPMRPSTRSELQRALELAIMSGRLQVLARVRQLARLSHELPAGEDISVPAQEPEPTPIPSDQPEPGWFELQVVDEVGDPIPQLRLAFVARGLSHELCTNADGVARLDHSAAPFARVRVVSHQELRDALTPRWQTPRAPRIPESSEDAPVYVERLDAQFDPIELVDQQRAVLVITPRFACREVEATTFGFGRSFVRSAGIASLAAVAQELEQDDGQQAMLFGHTDQSGPAAVNKRLSERRAHAVYALLTHDFQRWDDLWRARLDEHPWHERWGTRELQHMLNALCCPDDEGLALVEDGRGGPRTNQAIRRFCAGDYPRKPAEQAMLPNTNKVDQDLRRELFLAYAKLVCRTPVSAARFESVGGSPFMGCGEYNPLSLEARDERSRRNVVFIFDPAAAPAEPPCKIGQLGPCQARLDDPPPDAGSGPLYRCRYYKQIASGCPCNGGPDLAHDLIVRFFMGLDEANALPHRFILEAEDEPGDDDDDGPSFTQAQSLSADARVWVRDAAPSELVELHFTHVPDAHAYRLRVDEVDGPHAVFVQTRFHQISELSSPDRALRFPQIHAILNPPPAPPPPSEEEEDPTDV